MAVSEVLLAFGLIAIAMWQRHIILYVGSCIGLLLYGFHVAEYDIKMGIPLLIIAGYFMYKTITEMFRGSSYA